MNRLPSSVISRTTRLGSMILDHFFMCIIAAIITMPVLFFVLMSEMYPSPRAEKNPFSGSFMYFFPVCFALYFCKDSINGRSLAKRITRLQVLNHQTGEAAGPLRCFVRNLTTMLWPIEVIVSWFNTSRRIGDRIAGTRVDFFDTSMVRAKTSKVQVIAAFAASYLLCLLLLSLMPGVPSIGENDLRGLNRMKTAELKEHLASNTSYQLDYAVRVYDSVGNKAQCYVWVYGNLHKNYLSDHEFADRMQEKIKEEIDKVFADEDYRGKLQLRYKKGGSMQMRSSTIGGKIHFSDAGSR